MFSALVAMAIIAVLVLTPQAFLRADARASDSGFHDGVGARAARSPTRRPIISTVSISLAKLVSS